MWGSNRIRSEPLPIVGPSGNDVAPDFATFLGRMFDAKTGAYQVLGSTLGVEQPGAMVIGHSMGGMLAARFATQYPAMVERLVLYNPIGLVDVRFDRPLESADDAYKRNLTSTYDTVKAALLRYVAHNPAAWTPQFEAYARIRYSWTLSPDWPRLAMVQTLLSQVQYLDPVVDDWAHIKAPTLVFGGAEDSLPGSAALFRDRMRFIADTIPNGNARLHLIPGLGHVPHMEAPEKTYAPLIAFLREGISKP